MNIRPETPEDTLAIYQVNKAAFGRPDEAILVNALRADARPYISLVAENDKQVVGHIFFSPVSIESETHVFTAIGLAPLAVLPAYQRQGIGSRLVTKGLDECRNIGHFIVVVLGHPTYYPRFGFITAAQRNLSCEYPVPDDVFMVAELAPGALGGRHGLVKYHPAFAAV